jgi:hypothetical protein
MLVPQHSAPSIERVLWKQVMTENHAMPARFYAGEADPSDPSHFTIGYIMGSTTGTIDGRLVDAPGCS